MPWQPTIGHSREDRLRGVCRAISKRREKVSWGQKTVHVGSCKAEQSLELITYNFWYPLQSSIDLHELMLIVTKKFNQIAARILCIILWKLCNWSPQNGLLHFFPTSSSPSASNRRQTSSRASLDHRHSRLSWIRSGCCSKGRQQAKGPYRNAPHIERAADTNQIWQTSRSCNTRCCLYCTANTGSILIFNC